MTSTTPQRILSQVATHAAREGKGWLEGLCQRAAEGDVAAYRRVGFLYASLTERGAL